MDSNLGFSRATTAVPFFLLPVLFWLNEAKLGQIVQHGQVPTFTFYELSKTALFTLDMGLAASVFILMHGCCIYFFAINQIVLMK